MSEFKIVYSSLNDENKKIDLEKYKLFEQSSWDTRQFIAIPVRRLS